MPLSWPVRALVIAVGLCLAAGAQPLVCTFSIAGMPGGNVSANGANYSPLNLTASDPSCDRTITSSEPWLIITLGATGAGSGAFGFSVQPNPSIGPRSATIRLVNSQTNATQTWTVTQAGASCAYSLNAYSATVPAGGGAGSFTVNTPNECSWTAVSNSSWLHVTGPAGPAVGPGTITYSVDSHSASLVRSATITVNNAVYTVTQSAACSYIVNPSSIDAPAGGSGGSITVETLASCSWTMTAGAGWVTLLDPRSGSGNGRVSYVIAPNTAGTPRNTSISVSGVYIPVTQPAAVCVTVPGAPAYNFNPQSRSTNIPFTLNSGCSWTASTSASFITLTTASGTASSSSTGAVSFNLSTNLTGAQRGGVIQINEAPVTVTQDPCTYTLYPQSLSLPMFPIGTQPISVTALSGCTWTAASGASWLTITSGASGSGNGNVGYSVQVNDSGAVRSTVLTIAGQPVNVEQASNDCRFTITPPNFTFEGAGGVGIATLAASNKNCAWGAASNNEWIQLISPAAGNGNSALRFSVLPNTTGNARSGSVTAAGIAVAVAQNPVVCVVKLGSSAALLPAEGGAAVVNVTVPDGCQWSAAPQVDWLAANVIGSGGGSARVEITAGANAGSRQRAGAVFIGGVVFTVTQAGNACTFGVTPRTAAYSSRGGSGSVAVATTCQWTAVSDAPWIALAEPAGGTGNGQFGYTVAANSTGATRTGVITVGGETVHVTQAGGNCAVALTPSAANFAPAGDTVTFKVASPGACSWTPASDSPWLNILSWGSVSGQGQVTVAAEANGTGQTRAGAITVGDQVFAASQGAGPVITRAGVANAASAVAGPVAPGEIVVLYGAALGPKDLTLFELDETRTGLRSVLAGTQVFFGRTPAPLLYVSETQLAAIVPYEVAGLRSTEVKVVRDGVSSPLVRLDAAPAAPGLFTVDKTGTGQGAIVNAEGGQVNSPATPAARGGYVMIFLTGEGQTRPPGVTGAINFSSGGLPRPLLDVTVEIGGLPATVTYSGAAPDAVAGLMQINAQVPAGVQPGAQVPVVVRIGGAASQPGVTMAVR